MRWERAFAGMSRTESSPVDETAITLKLEPVRALDRWRPRWPTAFALTTAALTVAIAASFVGHAPEVKTAERVLSPRIRVRPKLDDAPILAATMRPTLELPDPDEEELAGIVIFDEPPPRETPAARRARARNTARMHVSVGHDARRVGDLAVARREFEAALGALPSYGPAAAALAEIHRKQGSHHSALKYAKRAARSAPRKLDYMVLLGDAYARTNHRATAEKLWRKAAAYGSREASARLGRG